MQVKVTVGSVYKNGWIAPSGGHPDYNGTLYIQKTERSLRLVGVLTPTPRRAIPFSDFVSPELAEGRIPTSDFIFIILCPLDPDT